MIFKQFLQFKFYISTASFYLKYKHVIKIMYIQAVCKLALQNKKGDSSHQIKKFCLEDSERKHSAKNTWFSLTNLTRISVLSKFILGFCRS